MKKMYILSLSLIITSSLLMACGDKKDVEVTAMENIAIETETNSETETTTEIETETETKSEIETESLTESTSVEEETTESIEDKAGDAEENTYTVTDLDETMYATQKCNIRVQPSIQDDVIGSLLQTQEIHVTGKVNDEVDWYRVSLSDGVEGYISASFLTTTKPIVQVTPSEPSSETVTPSDAPLTDDQVINPLTGQPIKPGDILPSGEINGGIITKEDGTMVAPNGSTWTPIN